MADLTPQQAEIGLIVSMACLCLGVFALFASLALRAWAIHLLKKQLEKGNTNE